MGYTSIQHQNTSDKVLSVLQNRIIARQLKPNERIYVEQLSREFGISQTPIREALYKLEGMKLVTIKPRMGVYVTSFSEQAALEVLDIRIVLENLAIQKIVDLDQNQIKAMENNLALFRETIRARDVAENNKVDSAFHLIIMEAAQSRQLTSIYSSLHSQWILQRVLYKNDKTTLGELRTVEKEHVKIVEAFKKKDKKEMKKAMRSHLNNVRLRVARSLQTIERITK